MLNEKLIKILEGKGFKRWTKGSMDRLYINPEALGLAVEYNRSGNVLAAEYRGERISNSVAREMLATKTYIDVETGTVSSASWTLRCDVRAMLDEARDEEEAEADTQAPLTGSVGRPADDEMEIEECECQREEIEEEAEKLDATAQEALEDQIEAEADALRGQGPELTIEGTRPRLCSLITTYGTEMELVQGMLRSQLDLERHARDYVFYASRRRVLREIRTERFGV